MIDIKGLIEARLKAYDPLIDLSENGFAQELIIKPIVKAFGADPMVTDIRSFLIAKFNELYPNTTLSNGDAISDILISVSQLFFEAYRQELQTVKKSLSIDYLDQMSDSDANALASNWLVSRRVGTKATGTIRVIVNRLAAISINTTNLVRATNGFIFLPTNFDNIDTGLLLTNRLANGNYFFDLNVTATQAGTLGNIAVGSIASISNIAGLVSVTNSVAFTGGSDTEDNQALLRDRLPRAATERSLVTKRGITARIENYTSTVNSVEVVGFGDIEMTRDATKLSNSGQFKAFGAAYIIGRLVFITIDSVKNTIISGDIIRGTNGLVLNVIDVIVSQEDPILLNSGKSFIVYVDKDTSPSGSAILFTLESKPYVRIGSEVFSDAISLGGKTDVYIEPSSFSSISNIFPPIENIPEKAGFGFTIMANRITLNEPIVIDSDSYLQITEGVFKIIHSETFAQVTRIYINEDLTDGIFVSYWRIFKQVEVPISKKEITILGLDQGITCTITTTGLVLLDRDLGLYLLPGDILRTENNQNFLISAVFGERLQLEKPLAANIFNIKVHFVRTTSTNILPASDITSVMIGQQDIPSNRCLGLEPINISSPKVLSKGTGFVSRCLLDMFVDKNKKDNAAQMPLLSFSKSKFKIRSLSKTPTGNRFDISYNVDARFDIGALGSGYAELDEDMSVAMFLDGKQMDAFDDNGVFLGSFDRMFYIEVPLFNDMLISGANNIFIALGDGVTDYEFPIYNFTKGNILSITEGVNKGNYVIDKVINLRLPNNFENIQFGEDYWRKPITISGELLIQVNQLFNQEFNVYTVTYNTSSSQNTNALFRNISIVKIKDKFPVNPFDILNTQFDENIIIRNISREDINDSEPGINIFDFSRINDIFINQIKSTTIKTLLDIDASNKLSKLVRSKFPNIVEDNQNPLVQFDESFLDKLYKVQYMYGIPAKGSAYLFLEHNVPVKIRGIQVQKYTNKDINTLTADRVSKDPNKISVVKKLKPYFYASKKNLKLILDEQSCVSVIGQGQLDDKKTWPRGLSIDSVNTTTARYAFMPNRNDPTADILDIPGALEMRYDYDDISIQVCPEIYVQKRTVRFVNQVFFPYIPLYIPDDDLRNAVIATAPFFSAGQVASSDEYDEALGKINGDGITIKEFVDFYISLGTYAFLKISQADYENDPEVFKELPLGIDIILQPLLPGDTYEERNSFWKDVTNVQSSDLIFYGYEDSDTELTGICLAESIKYSNELKLLSPISYTKSSFDFKDSLLSADVYVDHNGSLLDIFNVDDYDQQTGTIKLTKPISVTTPRVYNVGRIFYTVENKLIIYGFQGIETSTDNVLTYVGNLRSKGNESGLLLDVTRSVLSNNDVGKFMTIFNYVQSPIYTGVQDDEAFEPIRQHIGCYKIVGVDNVVRRSQFTGRDVIVSQSITLDEFPNLLNFKNLRRLQIDDTEPLPLCFVITDAPEVTPIKNDDGTTSITTLLPVQVYARNPVVLDVIGVSLDNNKAAVKIISQDSIPSVDKISPFLFKEGVNNLNMSFDKNNPFIMLTKSLLVLDEFSTVGGMFSAKIDFQSVGLEEEYALAQGEGFDTYNEIIDGFRIITDDIDVARSTKEQISLVMPPRILNVSPILNTITIGSETNYAVSVVESIFASEERVVCSDTIIKEKVRSYIGAEIKYSGNVSEKVVIEAIIKVFNNALLSNTPIAISTLIQYLHRIGVSRVIMPIRLYHIVVDLDRRVYYRPIKDVLHPNTDLDILATARLLMTIVPSYDQTIHGAKVVATRVLDTTLIG